MCVLVMNTYATDYEAGRMEAQQRLHELNQILAQTNPKMLSDDFTNNPKEMQIDTMHLKEQATGKASESSLHQDAKTHVDTRKKESLEDEMALVSDAMTQDENSIRQGIPCQDGSCLPAGDMPGEDFGEGIGKFGTLAGVADGARGVDERNAGIFTGSNATCRIAIAGIGNCCTLHAHLLRCRQDEKDLSIARSEGRAAFVGRYCAHRKLKVCLEKKESWCVFKGKLAGIIQLQGRAAQLGISFGYAGGRDNFPDCRGLTPREMERIDFSRLDLRAVEADFKARYKAPDADAIERTVSEKIIHASSGGT